MDRIPMANQPPSLPLHMLVKLVPRRDRRQLPDRRATFRGGRRALDQPLEQADNELESPPAGDRFQPGRNRLL